MKYQQLIESCNNFLKISGIVGFSQQNANILSSWAIFKYERWLENKALAPDFRDAKIIDLNLDDLPANYTALKSNKIIIRVRCRSDNHGTYVNGTIVYNEPREDIPNRYGGKYSSILIDIISPRPANDIEKTSIINQINETVIHELRHWSQFLIAGQNTTNLLPQQSRNDNQSININDHFTVDNNFNEGDNDPFHDEKFRDFLDDVERKNYLLSDLELQPWIGDEASKLMTTCNNKPTKSQINFWIGNPKPNRLTSKFFSVLYEEAPKRWKYAAREFYRLITDYYGVELK